MSSKQQTASMTGCTNACTELLFPPTFPYPFPSETERHDGAKNVKKAIESTEEETHRSIYGGGVELKNDSVLEKLISEEIRQDIPRMRTEGYHSSQLIQLMPMPGCSAHMDRCCDKLRHAPCSQYSRIIVDHYPKLTRHEALYILNYLLCLLELRSSLRMLPVNERSTKAYFRIGTMEWYVESFTPEGFCTELLLAFVIEYNHFKYRSANMQNFNEYLQQVGGSARWLFNQEGDGWMSTLHFEHGIYFGHGRTKREAQNAALEHWSKVSLRAFGNCNEWDRILLILAGDIETNPGPHWEWRLLTNTCEKKFVKHANGLIQCACCFNLFQCEDEANETVYKFEGCQDFWIFPCVMIMLYRRETLKRLLYESATCYRCAKSILKRMLVLKQQMKDSFVEDLTSEGIEPNPGPRRSPKGKGRDRSAQHVYDPRFTYRDLRRTIQPEDLFVDFKAMLKQRCPELLNYRTAESHMMDLLDAYMKTVPCDACGALFLAMPGQLVCECFTQGTLDDDINCLVCLFQEAMAKEQAIHKVEPDKPFVAMPEVVYDPPANAYVPQPCGYDTPLDREFEEGVEGPPAPCVIQELNFGPCSSYVFGPRLLTGITQEVTVLPAQDSLPEVNLGVPATLPEVAEHNAKILERRRLSSILGKASESLKKSMTESVDKRRAFSCIQEVGRKLGLDLNVRDGQELLKGHWKMPDVLGQLIQANITDEQQEQWKTTFNTFPQQWKFLLMIRPLIYLSGRNYGGFDLPPYADALASAWANVPRFCPQGKSLCVLGWDGLMREHLPRNSKSEIVPIIHPTCLAGEEEGDHRARRRLVRYVVGPQPYSNKLGFFFNELWTGEHYDWLENNSYRPVECFGEFCLYQRYGNISPSWWTVPLRFKLVELHKNLVMAGWWAFNRADKVAAIVDISTRNVFTNGATLHDGSYVSAAQRVLAQKFNYADYWTMVIQGTVTYYGQHVANENLEFLQARITDTDFRSYTSSWIANFRIADRIYHSLFKSNQLKGEVAHPLHLGPSSERGPQLGAIPSLTKDCARQEVQVECELLGAGVCDAVTDNALVKETIVQAKLLDRETHNWMSAYPLLCSLSETYQMKEDRLKAQIMLDRQNVRGLGNHEQEFAKSSARLWARNDPLCISDLLNAPILRHESPDLAVASAPFIQQMATWAVQNDQKVSIYELPQYDKNRIEVRVMRPIEDQEFSKQRPERLYWVHFGDLYVPSPHAAIWTVAMRCGKALPTSGQIDNGHGKLQFDPLLDAKFLRFCDSLYDRWDISYDPISNGLDSEELKEFMIIIENMPAAQRRKRLDWFLSFMAGNKKVNGRTMKFFTKTDESLFSNESHRWLDGTDNFLPSGKPRSIFNASDATFSGTQAELTRLKKQVKVTDEANILVEGYEVEMPRELLHDFYAHDVHYHVHLRYMADSDNIQDAAWMTQAWFGQPNHIYIEVGGDDNNTVMFHKGRRIEIEGDLSMCDQSMRDVFMQCYIRFLEHSKVPPEVIKMVKDTYSESASYFIKDELVCIVDFLDVQLKTGVAHTSFSNSFIVGMLMIFGLQNLLEDGSSLDSAMLMKGFLEQFWLRLGITMKLKIFVDAKLPLSTFHKRYFVPTQSGLGFAACSLPSCLVKMMCVKAPTLMNAKTFKKRLVESARSRVGMASNPLVRQACRTLGVEVQKVETESGFMYNIFNYGSVHDYGGSINCSDWAAREGDGRWDDHAWFMEQRYGIDAHDFKLMENTIGTLSIDKCYFAAGCPFGRLVWKTFATDYG